MVENGGFEPLIVDVSSTCFTVKLHPQHYLTAQSSEDKMKVYSQKNASSLTTQKSSIILCSRIKDLPL